jgi:hypothetical protein
MKTKVALIKSLGGYLRLGAAAGAVLASCGLPLHARAAAFDSPAGTWDVSLSGSRQGLAIMEFTDGGTPDTRTFSVYEIVVPPKPSSSGGSDPRSVDENRHPGTDDASRNGFISTGNSVLSAAAQSTPRLFGDELSASGMWGFDTKGRIVGFYGESLGLVCTTNIVTITNCINGDIPGQPCGFVTNIETVVCVSVTNGVNFVGNVVPNKSLTLAAQTENHKFTLRGLPIIALTNIAGSYVGSKTANGVTTFEFFTLSPVTPPVELPGMLNVYSIVGGSADYSYMVAPGFFSLGGTALLSRSGRIAFAIPLDPDGFVFRATLGGFDRVHLRFNTMGVEQSSGILGNFIRFNGALAPTGP